MSTDEPFRTDYEFLKGVDYIFVSLDRNLSGEECHELAEKYFETHKQMTLPGQVLRVDLRPLADVTPQFRTKQTGGLDGIIQQNITEKFPPYLVR
jgi:hypothetical protein